MFERILVPLDGSAFAERALEPAFNIARAFGSELVLLQATTPEEVLAGLPAMAPRFWSIQADGQQAEAAESYLQYMAAQWSISGVPVRSEVVPGAPAEAIVAAAQRAGADLIVMSTHGRSAVGRIIYGSVAEAVLRGAQMPVLLIPMRMPFA